MYSRSEIKRGFALGRTAATGAALLVLQRAGLQPTVFFERHSRGDWGIIGLYERFENELAVMLKNGRVRSTYEVDEQQQVVVVTEADRSLTLLLLGTEY